ncbi:MAG: hypothetical protein ACOCVU_01190 [Desulfohalobiaceae bacterium]
MKTLLCSMTLLLLVISTPGMAMMSADDKPAGTFCCVDDVCVVARTADECRKIGGTPVSSCQDCPSEENETRNGQDAPRQ